MDPDSILHESLTRLRAKDAPLAFCVVGAGHGGLAMAGHLGIQGYPVRLYNRSEENLHAVRWHGGIQVTGEVEGFGPVQTVTSRMAEALDGVDIVMVVVPANAHEFIADQMAGCLQNGQLIVLNPGRTGGALAFRHALKSRQAATPILIGETSTFLYASRAVSRAEARIFRIKNTVRFATLPAYFIPEALPVLQRPFPQFASGDSVLATGMENIGAIFHPALTLLNAGWIEGTRGAFDYYRDGITPAVARALERLDAERVAVSAGLGVHAVSAREWLYLTYGASGADLHEAIQNTTAYIGIQAPQSVFHRYVTEDVPMSLVPLASLGRMLGVPMPMTEMTIALANAMHEKDFWSDGRTVSRMGIEGLSVKQIRQLAVGID